jgi:hypothetical protein
MAKDMCPTSSGTTAVGAMYKNMETLESNIESVIKVAFPDKYNDMKAICEPVRYGRGRVVATMGVRLSTTCLYILIGTTPTLGFLCRSLQGDSRADICTSPSLSLCSSQSFSLSFDLRFLTAHHRYSPCSLAAFYADCTIHAVGDWKAVHMEAGDETTPGRIGTVFYIPQSSAEALAGKEPGWGLKTSFGRLPA